jgi:hypothetical protein
MDKRKHCKRDARFRLLRCRALGWLTAGIAAWVLAPAIAASRPSSSGTGDVPDSSELTATISTPPAGALEVLPAAANPIRPGESLRFAVQYGPVKAGTAYLEVAQIREWKGRPVYNLVARAESNSFFSRIYKVRNRIESFWDQEGLFSWRYMENRREGGHKFKNEIVFDHTLHQAQYADGHSAPIPEHVQDALSAFYYTRFQALPMGGSIKFDYHASKKSQPLEVKILGRERIETPAGKFDCVAIEPLLKAGGIFKNKGRLVIWLTEDERRMPVLMRSKVMIGSISVVLQEARLGV